MHWNTVQWTAVNCAALTCTAMNGIMLGTNILLYNAIYYYELHRTALYSAALQCTTLLLCTYIHCTALQWTSHLMWVSAGKQQFLKIANSWLSLMLYLLNKGMSQPSGKKEGPVQRFASSRKRQKGIKDVSKGIKYKSQGHQHCIIESKVTGIFWIGEFSELVDFTYH